MKIEKAIELNKESEKSLRTHKFPDYADAIQLGIEALKRVQFYNRELKALDPPLLPGEDSSHYEASQ